MAENKMKELAKLLGLELEEEFRLSGFNDKYKLVIDGVMRYDSNYNKWFYDRLGSQVFTGKIEIIKLPKPILDNVEKEYLSNVIKPFRKHIITIRKIAYYKYEYIEILIYRTDEGASCEVFSFPYFNKGEMYKGMEINKEYALKELGL